MSRIEEILKETKALLEGHFKLTSGRHSGQYIEKIKIIHDPAKVQEMCSMIVEKIKHLDPDVIVGPAMGGVALAYEVARQMGKKFIFTQRKDGIMTIRSGFPLEKGQKVVVIEDIITTGGSVFEVIECLKRFDLDLKAVALIADRSGGKIDFGVPTYPLITLNIQSWQPNECPLCANNIPINTPGSSGKK